MKIPLVSIIIPVYNVEKYLSQCLDSILYQTYTNWECLVIDDGSKDRCGAICDNYAAKDSRFKVFHKTNGGVSAARNYALDRMHGDWCCFVDADDVIAKDLLKICVRNCYSKSLDFLQYSYSNDMEHLGNTGNSYTQQMPLVPYIKSRKYMFLIWISFIKSDIINNNNIRFEESLKLGEDQIFTYICMSHAKRLQRIADILYWYRTNPNGATHRAESKEIIKSIKVVTAIRDKQFSNEPFMLKVINQSILILFRDLLICKDVSNHDFASLYTQCQIKSAYLDSKKIKMLYNISKISPLLGITLTRICSSS